MIFGRNPAFAASPSSRCASRPYGLQSGVKMTVRGELSALFRDATTRQRLVLAAILGAFLGTGAWGCSYVGTVMGNMVPVKRDVVVGRRVVRTEYVRVPRPPRIAYPPLKDPKEACAGAPVVIEYLRVAGWQGEAENDTAVNTWLTVRPAGDDYTVQCSLGGDNSDGWHKGDLVRLYKGQIAG